MDTCSSDEDDEAPCLVEVALPTTASSTPPLSPSEPDLPPCPVTILSGFLGSGKTTLIRYILNSPDHGKRIAVIENEFGDGDLAIESIIARDGVDGKNLIDLIELPNGCVCCTVKDSLVATLENLLDKRKDLDYIIIECSGMANPGPVATIFWLDDALDSRLRLDGIVTLCDARHIQEQFETTEEAAQQVAYADRILLNKIDLIQDNKSDVNNNKSTTLDGIVQSIRRFHPTAPIRQTTFAACDLDWILDARCFDADRIQAVEDSFVNVNSKAMMMIPSPFHISDGHDHNHGHSQATPHASQEELTCAICDSAAAAVVVTAPANLHEHTKSISTISLFLHGTVDLQKIDRWLASVLWPNQDERDNVLRELIKVGGGGDGDEDQTAAKPKEQNDQHKMESKDIMSIFRIKGILSVRIGKDSADYSPDHVDPITGIDRRRYIVQGVHDLWEIHPTTGKDMEWNHSGSCDDDEEEEEDRSCRLVVIGRYLDEESLRNGFYSCCSNSTTSQQI